MHMVIAGASGLVGSHLLRRLPLEVSARLLTRQRRVASGFSGREWIVWDPEARGDWEACIEGAEGVINLAGEPIAAKRWSAAQKQKIRSSRLMSTRALVRAIEAARNKPRFLINASAVGYYGACGDEIVTETSNPGAGFLAELCREWEEEARKAEAYGVRVVLLRSGIVLAKGQGALAKMVPPFKFFVGGPLGSGRQWMPWIHIEDEVGLILFLAQRSDAAGPFNATAPNPVRMDEFCKVLGDVLNRPAWAGVPASLLTLMLGEMADMLLTGQRAIPQAAQTLGYSFRYPTLEEALRSLVL
ncbi:MAG TPA: TIGR01777 family oxidoreductase [Candidatus Eisenbacteria bacterium]|nr:TIGR01777 family oxidoreductase [Candidatus Eisenbacteria bacterium]